MACGKVEYYDDDDDDDGDDDENYYTFRHVATTTPQKIKKTRLDTLPGISRGSWAGAVTQKKELDDRLTDRRTDRPTDIPSYRVA